MYNVQNAVVYLCRWRRLVTHTWWCPGCRYRTAFCTRGKSVAWRCGSSEKSSLSGYVIDLETNFCFALAYILVRRRHWRITVPRSQGAHGKPGARAYTWLMAVRILWPSREWMGPRAEHVAVGQEGRPLRFKVSWHRNEGRSLQCVPFCSP